MHRPSYYKAVIWIALNDRPDNPEDAYGVSGYLTVGLVADMFGIETAKVAQDVTELRAMRRYPRKDPS